MHGGHRDTDCILTLMFLWDFLFSGNPLPHLFFDMVICFFPTERDDSATGYRLHVNNKRKCSKLTHSMLSFTV